MNRIFVVSAPSGCGKGTILERTFDKEKAYFSVSYTTRPPRPGEVDGKHYNFISEEEFQGMIDRDEFLEHAGFADKSYGTWRPPVDENFKEGKDIILEIETNGAFQVKKLIPDAVMIFILPPSIKELERRLRKRGTETEEVIQKRLAQAKGEIERSFEYDYVIMNDDLDPAVEDFNSVIAEARGETPPTDRFRTYTEENKKMIREVLENA